MLACQHWTGWLTRHSLVLRFHEECCLDTNLYFLTPCPSTENFLWGGQISGNVWACWEWMVCAPSWDPVNFVAGDVMLPSPPTFSISRWVDSCLWGCGGCISLPLFTFGWALQVYTWPVTLCTWHHSIHFCFALSSSLLWIKCPYWSCRYVGWF